jgi:uncharacterized membrane protein SirB2
MDSMPKIKRRWWQILVFIQETYLALTGVAFLVLLHERADYGPTPLYMFWGYLAAIVGLFISGIVLIILGKKKHGLIALAFASTAIVWLMLILPAFAASHRTG